MISNKNKIIKNFIVTTIIITIVILSAFAFPKILLKYNQNENQEASLENFSLHYINDSKNTVNLRYKYIMNYEHGDIELSNDWDSSKPLFSLYEDGRLVHNMKLTTNQGGTIPEVSNSFKLKSQESTDTNFEIKVNKKAEEFQELIRFEVTIVVEELKENKWSPVYQVTFMERGPYWSLNKGPVELTPSE